MHIKLCKKDIFCGMCKNTQKSLVKSYFGAAKNVFL
jgi:hypothetical protein